MKTLIKLIAAIVIINLTSCKEDMIPHAGSNTEVDEIGEGLPEIYKEVDLEKKERIFSEKDRVRPIPEPIIIDAYEDIRHQQNPTRSRGVEGITFGHAVYSTTVGQGNSIEKNFGYSGEDRVYKLKVNQSADVEVVLKDLYEDLDLFVAKVLKDAYGRELVGDLIASSTESSSRNELINVRLSGGEYFIIVDSWLASGSFTLTVRDVNTPPPLFCENYENLTATSDMYYSVSRQLDTWTKWSPNSRDGLVLYEDYTLSNKVVKFDARRFGGQDAVRTLIGLPITSGVYTMDFKLFVPHGNSANFLSEKKVVTGNYANQGFMVRVKSNGIMEFTQGGNTKTARTRLTQGEWVQVFMKFDLEKDKVIMIVNSVLVEFKASAPLYSRGNYLTSIAGIDFYNKTITDKFHIDNVCVNEIEPGYEDPRNPYNLVVIEEEISFIEKN